ncbi:MAG: tRNA (pseudouridine(54)-N(1))-methyltransferase TrmY, partial [Halobacteria archaeon]|nr:tRNA (pseudouridine(54)-N(1))-methyltransferase TrmY [Halobacteria archaeon]
EKTVSLSPEILHADHSIVVAHNWLDTGGFGEY